MFAPLKTKGGQGGRWLRLAALVATVTVVVAGGTLLLPPVPVDAHCDSGHGPVVTAAKQALKAGDVDLVMPYVQANAAAELTAAFQQTLAVRKLAVPPRNWLSATSLRLRFVCIAKGRGALHGAQSGR